MKKLIFLFLMPFFASCAKDSCTLEEIFAEIPKLCTEEPCPPTAPADGPGSMKMRHSAVETITIGESFLNSYRSFLYLPKNPTPAKAPVLFFLHGYFDATPERYEAMLSYYARQGYIVIYPGYGNAVYAKTWTENAREAYRRSLVYLETHGPVKPDREQVAFVGHSIGGLLSFHLANEIGEGSAELPRPKLLVTSDMAGISTIAYPYVAIDDLSRLPSDTKILLMMAEETYRARFKEDDKCEDDTKKAETNCNGFSANLRVMKRTPQIPSANKTAILIASDKRGVMELKSDHNGAQGECHNAKKPVNAIDTWGYWRHALTAFDAELKGVGDFSRTLKINNSTSGQWSDGESAKAYVPLESCFITGQCPSF